jgi:hypothetical protein
MYRILIFGWCVAASGACGHPGDIGSPDATLPGEVFRPVRELRLQESADVVNVFPFVSVDDSGGYFVADFGEARARLYRGDGTLAFQVGSRGSGPGEFSRPVGGFRINADRILVADMFQGLSYLAGDGTFLYSVRPPVLPLYGVLPLSPTRALLMGRRPQEDAPSGSTLLHLWDLEGDSIITSFFPTPGDSSTRALSRSAGWVSADVSDDRITALFALSDTVYLFDHAGRASGSIPLQMRRPAVFRGVQAQGWRKARSLDDILARFVRFSDVVGLPDGSYVLQFQRRVGRDSRLGLMRIDSAGRTLFEIEDTPRLLGYRSGEFIFQSPTSLTPDLWSFVALR